jgi:hypothetical protein
MRNPLVRRVVYMCMFAAWVYCFVHWPGVTLLVTLVAAIS